MATRAKDNQSPHMLVMASCVQEKFKDPFTGTEYTKETLGVLVVFFDMASVLCILAFAIILMDTQEEYVETFDESTIEMADFTVRVKNLPHHKLYDNNDEALRGALMAHFSKIVQDEIQYTKDKELFGKDEDFDDVA